MPVTLIVIMALNAAPSSVMEEGMREYFSGETRESFVFMAAGAASLGAAVPLFLEHGTVGRPMSVPLAVMGVVELVLGVGLFARTPRQVAALSEQLGGAPGAYKEEESRRMAGVMRGFQLYRLVELTLATTGAFMAGIGYVREAPTVCGVGLGLLVEAVTLLALDFFAEERGRKYSALLADFMP